MSGVSSDLSAPGLTAGYSFDEGTGTSAADPSSNHITGTLTRASWGTGRFGAGLALRDPNAYVTLGNPAALRVTGSLTVSAWINTNVAPFDDAAVVSKRAGSESGFQLDTTIDRGPRTVGWKLTNSSGSNMIRYGKTALAAQTWYHIAGVYDASARDIHVYVNGVLDDGTRVGTVTNTQRDSGQNVTIGRRAGTTGFEFNGNIDEVRFYSRALSAAEIQSDMGSGVGGGQPNNPVPPTTNPFRNELLATGMTLPTCIRFLPDGRLLLAELAGKVNVYGPPYTQPDAAPFLQLSNVGTAGVQQGIYDIALDPSFSSNHYFYVFYTAGTPNRDRLSRFTANAMLTGTVNGSEQILYEDPRDANAEHHGGAVTFGSDGLIYFATGEAFDPPAAQRLNDPRGKLHRIRSDGSVPTDNPFYDGTGPNWDSIWALGLRNPYRAYYDAPSGRLLIGDVGGNDNATAQEELNLGARAANYGWPDCEAGNCGNTSLTAPLYAYKHDGRDACITGGFVYHGSQFPSSYVGSYFFADYTQNWIKRITFNADGSVATVSNFEPADGSSDGPAGDIVYLTEGPDGALYYVDLGYSDVGATFGTSKLRRIRYEQTPQAPIAMASGSPLSGVAPLSVSFSSAGSSDPTGKPLTYQWNFGDGMSSSAASPTHVYTTAGQYSVRLTVSNGVSSTITAPLTVVAGSPPTVSILNPQDGSMFVAGDVISFSGVASDAATGTLADSAYTWNVDFLHEGHVHPGLTLSGVKTGSFTIPTTGHDFSGNTRYRITLTATNSSGLTSTRSVTVWPSKVNLSFATAPAGLVLYLDGIAKQAPFTYDTLPKYVHSVEARSNISGSVTYDFASWSDGGAQTHSIVVPATGGTYTATYTSTTSTAPAGLAAGWNFNEGTGTTAADSTVNHNTATLLTGATWGSGKYGGGVSTGSGSITAADSSSLDLASSFTFSAWVNPSGLSGYQTILIKEDSSGGTCGYWLQTNGSALSSGFYAGGTCHEHTAATSLTTGAWSHVAVTFDDAANSFKLYVNGTVVATQTETSSPVPNNAKLTFGRTIWGEAWNGRFDEVHIYNRALSASEVSADMNSAR